MITFQCSSCQQSLRIQDEASGKSVRCPSCGSLVSAPLLASPIKDKDNPFAEDRPDNSLNPYAISSTSVSANVNYGTSRPLSQLRKSDNPLGLIFGIMSILAAPTPVCCILFVPIGFVLGLAGWLISKSEKQKVEAGLLAPSGLMDAGYILGLVGICLNILVLLLGVAIVVIGTLNQPKNF